MEATPVTTVLPSNETNSTTAPTDPIAMSFPAVLRGPGGDRFAHLRADRLGNSPPTVPKKNRRDEKEGKRWIRRKENDRFVGNPHIAKPAYADLSVPVPRTRPTFPSPLPHYLPRTAAIPAAIPGTHEPGSASAGQFSMSMKGMRKELRGRGVMTEVLVREVEVELVGWLNVDVWVDPDVSAQRSSALGVAVPVGSLGVIREVEKTHMQLVWEISDDAFARYVVHCCARYHNVVSFSKEGSIGSSPARRLTYILRPHIPHASHNPATHLVQGLDTPPPTDLSTDFDSAGGTDFGGTDMDVESDFAFSEVDSEAELEGVPPTLAANSTLIAVVESTPGFPHVLPVPVSLDSDLEHDADVEHSDRGSEFGEDELADSVASLEITPRHNRRIGIRARSRPWDRQRRAASSPSGSPARRNPVRRVPRVEPPVAGSRKTSFYEYLFS